jgi:hypothetical protein
LNKMQEWIFRVMMQFLDESSIESKGIVSKWHNDYGVLAREKI